jgi:hypothetical protein
MGQRQTYPSLQNIYFYLFLDLQQRVFALCLPFGFSHLCCHQFYVSILVWSQLTNSRPFCRPPLKSLSPIPELWEAHTPDRTTTANTIVLGLGTEHINDQVMRNQKISAPIDPGKRSISVQFRLCSQPMEQVITHTRDVFLDLAVADLLADPTTANIKTNTTESDHRRMIGGGRIGGSVECTANNILKWNLKLVRLFR